MGRLWSPAFVLFAIVLSAAAYTKRYDGCQVWRLQGESSLMKNLLSSHPEIEPWSSGDGWLEVLVEDHSRDIFQQLMHQYKLTVNIVAQDLQRDIDEEKQRIDDSRAADQGVFEFDQYHSFEEITQYLSDVSSYDDRVTLSSEGLTIEGRDLWVVRLATDPKADKPAIWIDCGIHAREWMSPATCLWILSSMLDQYGTDATVTAALDTFNIAMLPVMNADGYAYSWSDDRYWRKNRHQFPLACTGVDLNRNYNGSNFGGIGSSNDHCSETYHGEAPLSEAETSLVAEQLHKLSNSAKGLKASFSLHSYGAMFLFAYGYKKDMPADLATMMAVGEAGALATAAVAGNHYDVGPHYTVIYPACGTVVDHGYEREGLPYTYIIEAQSDGGFTPDANTIPVTAEEIYRGILAALLKIAETEQLL